MQPQIKVIGVGGSGSNTISRMEKFSIKGVELLAINTDAQALHFCRAHKKILIGKNITKGLGTGMDAMLGQKAAEENKEEIIENLKGADMVFITCGLGGGCLRGNSLVLTSNGPIRIDSIKKGAIVYSFENNSLVKRKVLASMKTGVKKILELKTKNRTIYASEDHPFLKVKPLNSLSNNRFSKFDLTWLELKNLKKGEFVTILKKISDEKKPFKLPNNSFADEKFCQLFGFLLGDGWISKSKDSWKLYFSPGVDGKQNQKYINLIKEIFGVDMKRRSENWYQGGSKKAYELLEKLGLHKPAKEKEIPNWIFSLPESCKKSFIIGLAEADASYSIQIGKTGLPKKEIKFEMASEKLIYGLKVLCDSIGLRTSNVSSRTRFIKPPHSKEARNFTSWIFRIYRTQDLLGELPHLKSRNGESFLYKFRSRKTPDFFNNFGFNRVESVKEIGEEEVYDITVEGSHNFVADGFVVHNTGSGAAPVIAEVAKEMGILTIAVVTTPFSFEGAQRKKVADEALASLKLKVDSLLVISNDKLLKIIDEKTTVASAFLICDEILREAVAGITDLILVPGIITIDFASVLSIMKNSGMALFGTGKAVGENRAILAAQKAITSPLLDFSIKGAKGVLFNASGQNITLNEIQQAAEVITKSVEAKAQIIFGAVKDDSMKKEEIKITVIATNF